MISETTNIKGLSKLIRQLKQRIKQDLLHTLGLALSDILDRSTIESHYPARDLPESAFVTRVAPSSARRGRAHGPAEIASAGGQPCAMRASGENNPKFPTRPHRVLALLIRAFLRRHADAPAADDCRHEGCCRQLCRTRRRRRRALQRARVGRARRV